jgi:electron transport complex protein RnfD
MAGRAFVAACFGALMTTWTVPATFDNTMPVVSENTIVKASACQNQQTADAITKATPLAWIKDGLKKKVKAIDIYETQLKAMCLGNTAGCIGETSAVALLIGGIYLIIKRTITYHIPIAVLLGAFIFALIGHLINPDYFANPLLHLVSGGMLICAFFIATDPVTAPLPNKGMLIFGLGVGLLIMLIRTFGAYPEGVMYAVLLMNALTPLIDRFCKLIPAGGKLNA